MLDLKSPEAGTPVSKSTSHAAEREYFKNEFAAEKAREEGCREFDVPSIESRPGAHCPGGPDAHRNTEAKSLVRPEFVHIFRTIIEKPRGRIDLDACGG